MKFKPLARPLLDQNKCGCGKQARYYYQEQHYESEIIWSCNSTSPCPTYRQLEKRVERLLDFVRSMLDPERNGHAVNEYVREQARGLLGMKKTETSQENQRNPT